MGAVLRKIRKIAKVRKLRRIKSKVKKKSKYEVHEYEVGDSVSIFWDDKWFDGHVIQVGPNIAYKIHYDGWESGYDESVDITLCKWRNGTEIKDAAVVKEGDKLKVLWGGTWYVATVLDIDTAVCKVRYENYGPSWDTWCTRSEVKPRKARKKSKATIEKKSKNKVIPDFDHEYEVGDSVSIFWYDKWFHGHVIQVGPNIAYKIHYNGWESGYDESVDVTLCNWRNGSKIKDATVVKKGDKLTVLWGGTWYDATVLDIDTAVCKVRYENYGPSWDTWCTRSEVKPRKTKESKATVDKKIVYDINHEYKVNDKVNVFWYDHWYKGHVIQVGPNIAYKIHYDGWEIGYDESVDVTLCKWRNGSKIKDATVVKEGDKLTVLWGGTWYDATVLDIDTAVCKVRYKNYGPSWDTWCTRSEVKPA